MKQVKPMLTRGNAHLGPLFHTFSIPAFSTCPGATYACLAACYALDFLFSVRTNLEKHRANWERALDPGEFSRSIIAEIRVLAVRTLRVHVAGDFFSADYVRAWTEVARKCGRTELLFYTRSWRVPEIREALIELAGLPNVHAFWSEDRDTGPCDIPVGRRCFLCAEATDEALVPPGVLVFREATRTPRKFLNGSWVCPKEQGTGAGITCSSCRRCILTDPWPIAPDGRGRDGSASGTKVSEIASA
jgi:hypothetical protein